MGIWALGLCKVYSNPNPFSAGCQIAVEVQPGKQYWMFPVYAWFVMTSRQINLAGFQVHEVISEWFAHNYFPNLYRWAANNTGFLQPINIALENGHV